MKKESESWFCRFAEKTFCYAGRPVVFGIAVTLIVVWAATGPMFKFGYIWQLIVNTSTTTVTLLVVFLIRNSQNRDSAALQIKLDKLLRVRTKANNALMNLLDFSEEKLERTHAEIPVFHGI